MSGMSITSLETVLITWVKSKIPTGWTAVWGDQNAPKIETKQVALLRGKPYIKKLGRDFYGKVDSSDDSRPVLGTRELSVEFRSFGPGAFQTAEDLRTLLDDETAEDALIAGALAVIDTGPIQNLTSLYDSQKKEVASFEIRLRTHSLRESADAEQGVGYIELVDLEVTTQDPAGVPTVENIHVDTSP